MGDFCAPKKTAPKWCPWQQVISSEHILKNDFNSHSLHCCGVTTMNHVSMWETFNCLHALTSSYVIIYAPPPLTEMIVSCAAICAASNVALKGNHAWWVQITIIYPLINNLWMYNQRN
jgi:hypothetical protein